MYCLRINKLFRISTDNQEHEQGLPQANRQEFDRIPIQSSFLGTVYQDQVLERKKGLSLKKGTIKIEGQDCVSEVFLCLVCRFGKLMF